MAAPAQLERLQVRQFSIEFPPLRLTRPITLSIRKIGKQGRFRHRLQKRIIASVFRREEYYAGDFQRRFGDPKTFAPQIQLELLDAASASDDRRFTDRCGLARLPKPAQGVGANVHKV